MAKFSRAQLAQIGKRARLVGYQFDPKWKCLICGTSFKRCYEHSEADNLEAIQLSQSSL